MTTIEFILHAKGPLMSSELAKHLSIKIAIPINTASQQVSRDTNIKKIKGFYSSNQSFCFLNQHEEDDVLSKKFVDSLYNHGKKYWYCINALRMSGGTLSKKFLECYTNYPIIKLKGHIPFNMVMDKFIKQDIVVYNGDYISLSPRFNIIRSTLLTVKTIEEIKVNILTSFNSLVKNTGIISYNTGEIFSEYGKFSWAFKGVSNVNGLVQNGRAGFLLADIVIAYSIHKNDVGFFIEKIKHIQSYKNAPRIIPFFLVDRIDKKALELLKQKGIIIGFISEIFGVKYAENLKELITILKNAGANLKKTPEKYLDLIKELVKYNEGLLNNIKGTLFEYMVGHIHSVSCQSIDIGREIFENHGRHEMDILAVYNDKVVISECKAIKSMIDIDSVNNWKSIKIPAFKKWFEKQETYNKKRLEFEFWSTSGFTPDALENLERFSQSVHRYKVRYYQESEIREKAISMKNKKLKEVLDNFFFKSSV